jgi:hypothetical protein
MGAVERFERMHFDPQLIVRNSARFGPDRFAMGFKTFVDKAMREREAAERPTETGSPEGLWPAACSAPVVPMAAAGGSPMEERVLQAR